MNEPIETTLTQPMPNYQDKDRITMILKMHHEHRGDQPKTVDNIGHFLCETKEEAYSKRYDLGEEWIPLRFGDLDPDQVGFVTIDNLEGKHHLTNPTKEQLAEIATHIVEVSMSANPEECFLVLPGWAHVFLPVQAKRMMIRCRNGKANIRTMVFPK